MSPSGAPFSGVDSSLISAVMQEVSTSPVKTYTVRFLEEQYNEADMASAIAKQLGTDHTEITAEPDTALRLVDELPDVYDEPFADPSQIPTLLVSKLARRTVTVALSGDAGTSSSVATSAIGKCSPSIVLRKRRPPIAPAGSEARASMGNSNLPRPRDGRCVRLRFRMN